MQTGMSENQMLFQSTPSPRRETLCTVSLRSARSHFNPLPPQGGRRRTVSHNMPQDTPFQSTPSPRRETALSNLMQTGMSISIHSLPKEGDRQEPASPLLLSDFNPLPPQGGRLQAATPAEHTLKNFNPLPPQGGRRRR